MGHHLYPNQRFQRHKMDTMRYLAPHEMEYNINHRSPSSQLPVLVLHLGEISSFGVVFG